MGTFRRARAFTMIELMFVVAILGVLLAIIIPKLGGSAERAAVETTGRNIARLSEYARQMAISKQQETTITFDIEGGRWWLQLPYDKEDRYASRIANKGRRDEHVAMSDEEEINTLHPRVSFREILIDDQPVRDDRAVITYYPNGSSTGAQIIIQNHKGRTLTVEVEPGTGRASAYQGEPKDFAAKLEEIGIDPTKYGLTSSTAAAVETKDGERFYRIGGTEDRVNYYSDVAEKIMNRTRNNYEKQTTGQPGGTQPPGKATPSPMGGRLW